MRLPICGFGGLAIAALANTAHGEPLIASAGVLTRLWFTDNLFMSSQQAESDTVLQVLPNITSARTGTRGAWRFFYGPSALYYTGHSELNRVFHVLSANANYDLIKDYLGIQVAANANQNLVDPGAANVGFNSVSNPDAFAQTATLSISPVIRFSILSGDFAKVRFEPGINYVFAARTVAGGSSGTNGSASSLAITSGSAFSRLTWSLNASSNLVDLQQQRRYNGSGTTQTLARATYVLTNQWQIEGLIGYDFGNYQSQQDPNGFRWRVTPYWQPSPRARIGVGFGYRFDGNDYYLDLRYQRARTALAAKYDIIVTNARDSLREAQVVNFQNPFGQPVTQPLSSQLLSGSISNPPLTAGYYIQNHFMLSASHRFNRTAATLNVDNWRYDYQDTGAVVNQNQGTLSLDRSLSRRASGSLGLQYWTNESPGGAAERFEQVSLWTQFTYQLTRRTSGSLRYTYNQQNSATSARRFDTNTLWLTLTWNM